jgi:predicted transcriptional regulator YdeE
MFRTERRFVGIRSVIPSSFDPTNTQTEWQVRELFDRLTRGLFESLNFQPSVLYGISEPADTATPPLTIHYFAGVESDRSIGGFDELLLPPGKYFSVTFRGPVSEIDTAIREIYGGELERSGLHVREGLHLEIYDERFDPNSPNSEIDILIPVT